MHDVIIIENDVIVRSWLHELSLFPDRPRPIYIEMHWNVIITTGLRDVTPEASTGVRECNLRYYADAYHFTYVGNLELSRVRILTRTSVWESGNARLSYVGLY